MQPLFLIRGLPKALYVAAIGLLLSSCSVDRVLRSGASGTRGPTSSPGPSSPGTLESGTLTTLQASGVDFGSVVIGNTATQTIQFSNPGTIAATSLSITPLTGAYSLTSETQADACGTSLAPSQTCSIVVAFSPASAGVAQGSLVVSYNGGGTSQTIQVSLTGKGVEPAALTLAPPQFNYGSVEVGVSVDQTFTLSNEGQAAATGLSATALMSPFSFKGSGNFPGSTGTCTATLAPGASCTVVVTFAPTAGAASNSSLALAYNDGVQNQSVTATLTGTGLVPAKLVIDSPVFSYGSIVIGNSLDHTFTITNTGQAQATGIAATNPTAPFSFKGGAYPGGGTCGAALAPAASCTVVVTFAPTAAAESISSFLLAYNDGFQAQTVSAILSGTGLSPRCSLSTVPLSITARLSSAIVRTTLLRLRIKARLKRRVSRRRVRQPLSASKAVLTLAAEPAARLSLRPRLAPWW